MENIGVFVSENFQFLEMKLSIYWNRSVFVMRTILAILVKGDKRNNSVKSF